MSSLFITINEITLTNQVHVLSNYININSKNQYGCAEKKVKLFYSCLAMDLKTSDFCSFNSKYGIYSVS